MILVYLQKKKMKRKQNYYEDLVSFTTEDVKKLHADHSRYSQLWVHMQVHRV